MSKLPVISGKECIKALEKIGFLIVRQRGSHIVLVKLREANPEAFRNIVSWAIKKLIPV